MKLKLKHIIGIAVIVAALCFAGGMAAGVRSQQGEEPKITEDLISSRIEEISQLASVEYHYTKVGKYEDRIDFYGWQVPLTMKRFIISYDGTIWAGVHLQRAAVKIDDDGSVEVTLPEAEILAHEQDLDSITVFDETKNLFNPVQITDYIEFSKDQKQSAEEEAIGKGLLVEAQRRAEETVTEWLATILNTTGATPEIRVVSTAIKDAE